jgi:hypothetical protein
MPEERASVDAAGRGSDFARAALPGVEQRLHERWPPPCDEEKTMHPMDEEMRRGVDACLTCHRVCLTTFSQHCLDVGGPHVEPRHTRLMLACAEICRTCAFFMELGTEFHKRTCAVCAEVCAECAKSCEGFDDMQECAEACRRCAESCRRFAA